MNFYCCDRCACGLPSNHKPYLLRGGFRANLCFRCMNEFTASLPSLPLQARETKRIAEAAWLEAMAMAGLPMPQEYYLQLEQENVAIALEIRALASEFCKPTKPE